MPTKTVLFGTILCLSFSPMNLSTLGTELYLLASTQGEYFACIGDNDRFRNFIGAKSSDALC